jgi:hypothetical protein
VHRRPAAAAARLALHCSAPWPPLCHTPAPLWCCKWFRARALLRCVELAALDLSVICMQKISDTLDMHLLQRQLISQVAQPHIKCPDLFR